MKLLPHGMCWQCGHIQNANKIIIRRESMAFMIIRAPIRFLWFGRFRLIHSHGGSQTRASPIQQVIFALTVVCQKCINHIDRLMEEGSQYIQALMAPSIDYAFIADRRLQISRHHILQMLSIYQQYTQNGRVELQIHRKIPRITQFCIP